MRRVILNGVSCVVGLKWALLDGRTKAELIREAERYDEPYDVIVLLKTQYALGRSQGKKIWKKSLSLAAVLARRNMKTEYTFSPWKMPIPTNRSGGLWAFTGE